jgi:hypothetical protein
LSLITAFVITLQKILKLTAYDNLIAAYYRVAYRSPSPDQDTVDSVKKVLKDNNIDINKLVEWRNCP